MDDPETGDAPVGAAREADGAGRAAGRGPGSDAGKAPASQKTAARRRRKRRRGRKVFATPQERAAHEQALRPDGRTVGANAGADPGLRPEPAPVAAARKAAPAPSSAQGAQRSAGLPARDDAAPARLASRNGEGGVFAALDLGTNNCRLLVAVPGRPGQFRVVDAFSRIVRLGEGLSASGRLSQGAMDRAVEALRICADKLAGRPGAYRRLVATEACRSAENGEEFLDRVARQTGLQLEIIDRRTEAQLAVSGCGSLIDRGTDAVVLFDIGGGSSEIALLDVSRRRSGRLADHIVAWTSLPVGVVSLAERFGGRDVTPAIFDAMIAAVRAMIDDFTGRGALGALAERPTFHLLGTSGTVTTLAGVHLDLPRYDRRRVDGLWMASDEVDAMVARLLGWDFDARIANPCIGADRADLVLAGCAILEAIRQVWPAPRLRVADRGLREGILSELMTRHRAWAGAPRHPAVQR